MLLLLFGLLRTGQVKLRKIDGGDEMKAVKAAWAIHMVTRSCFSTS
jgi:hypothetical protein